MSQTDVQARQQLLDALGGATDDLAEALTSLGAAYEQLDDQQADRLEQQLFRPVQRAYGSASTRHCRLRLSRTLRGGVLDFGQPRAKLGVADFDRHPRVLQRDELGVGARDRSNAVLDEAPDAG